MSKFVQEISYLGEKWPLRISYYAIKNFQEETGKDIGDIDTDLALLEVLLWYGLIAGHKALSRPMTLKREDMEFVLDESLHEFSSIVMSFFPTAEAGDEENKKK